MKPSNTSALFPIMVGQANKMSLDVRLPGAIGGNWGSRRTAEDVAPMPDEKTKAIIKEKIDALLKEHYAAPGASNTVPINIFKPDQQALQYLFFSDFNFVHTV